MSLDIKEIIETIEVNSDDLKGNRMLTNELIVDDVMLGLGYNKRKDKSVQRLYNEAVDWVVTTNSGKRLAVKVLAPDETLETASDSSETLEHCKNTRYSVLVVITGVLLSILRYSKEKLEYIKVKDISLQEELSEQDNALVEAISKTGFSIEHLDSMLKPQFSYENIVENIKLNKAAVLNSIKSILGQEIPDELIEKFIDSAVGNKNNDDSALASSSQYLEKIKELTEQNQALKDKLAATSEQIDRLKTELEEANENTDNNDNNAEVIEAQESEIDRLKAEIHKLEQTIDEQNNAIQTSEDTIQEKVSEIEELTKQLADAKNKANANTGADTADPDIQHKLDSYVEKIRELSVQVGDLEEERDNALKQIEEMKKEVDELSGSDLRFAEQLLDSIEDDKDDERSYVAVINKELLNYEDIHTFIGRCLQKLYDIKSFDASQYIFNGDVFKMDINSRFSDIVMNNKTYDVILASDNENEELNKLRVVFSHFSDVVFVCKKIGTLRKHINYRYDTPEEHEEIQLESDEYLPEEYDDQNQDYMSESNEQETYQDTGDYQENTGDYQENTGDYQEDASGYQESNYMPDSNEQGYMSEAQGFDNLEQNFGEQGFNTEESNFGENGQIQFDDNQFDESDQEQMPMDTDGQIPYFDEADDQQMPEMERRLLVAQLLNIDMLIWTEEQVKFNTIKYISTNVITFGINTSDDSYDKLLCKCIDAILAIEAFNGSKDLVQTLKNKDFSQANNFFKLYSPELSQYPRINGTRYVVAGIESVQQVAAALLDVCNIMNIDPQEIFLYFDAETSSQYIIENYDFDESAVRIAETTSYEPEEDTTPQQAIAIIKGNMFNHIVITKNSLKVHREIFFKALAVKTQYLGIKFDKPEKEYEAIGDMLTAARNSNIQIDYRAIGNVIGEPYMLVSNDESRVKGDHITLEIFGEPIYISRVEDWQMIHSLIKVHTALFNNTSIAVKSTVNVDAINYYGNKFETSEPSLGLAVNSFVDYVASCVKE